MNNTLESVSAKNDWDFYLNAENIKDQDFVRQTKEYFERGARKGFIEPLEFINLWWEQFLYFDKNVKTPYSMLQHFEALPLTDEQRHVLYGFILKFHGGYPILQINSIQHGIALVLIEEAFLSYAGNTPEKIFCLNGYPANLNEPYISITPLPQSYQYTAKDFEGFSAKNDWDFYHNVERIPNQKDCILFPKKYFQTGERAGFIEPLAFINLWWEGRTFLRENQNKPHSTFRHLMDLPLNDEVKHVFFGLLLKLELRGYPIDRKYRNDPTYDNWLNIFIEIEEAFLSYAGNTPEKKFCRKDEERQAKPPRLNQHTDSREYVSAVIEPAPPPVVEEKKMPKGRTKDSYNTKIKAKFFKMVIEYDTTIIGTKLYKNNDEKFTDYANSMRELFGLVVNHGTLENNWPRPSKPLDKGEKKLLRELLIAHNYKDLAVTIATTI